MTAANILNDQILGAGRFLFWDIFHFTLQYGDYIVKVILQEQLGS
jgi:hypothetical protein